MTAAAAAVAAAMMPPARELVVLVQVEEEEEEVERMGMGAAAGIAPPPPFGEFRQVSSARLRWAEGATRHLSRERQLPWLPPRRPTWTTPRWDCRLAGPRRNESKKMIEFYECTLFICIYAVSGKSRVIIFINKETEQTDEATDTDWYHTRTSRDSCVRSKGFVGRRVSKS